MTSQDASKSSQTDQSTYCRACGKPVASTALICLGCGTQQMEVRVQASAPAGARPVVPKSKAVAIALAIFMGSFTWLYTAKRDGAKFVLWLVWDLVFLAVWGGMMWMSMKVDARGDPGQAAVVAAIIQEVMPSLIFGGIVSVIVGWLWPVLEQTFRRREFFRLYPNG